MLQLGLFKGCNVAWFMVQERKGFKAQIYLVPTHSSWCSSVLRSVNYASRFQESSELQHWYLMIVQKPKVYSRRQSLCNIFLLLRICSDLFFFWLCYPLLLPELFHLGLQSAGRPSFFPKSPYRFWLSGFLSWYVFFWKNNDCLTLMIMVNHHQLLIWNDVFDTTWCARRKRLWLNTQLN